MKKIAFIIYYHKYNFYSLNAIVGALETDGVFEIIDFYFIPSRDKLLESLEEIVKKYNRIVVAISFYTTQLFETQDLIQIIKRKFKKKCVLVAGGPHPTGEPFQTLKLGFDIVVVGEGEETIIKFMQRIVNDEIFDNVKGIAYIDENSKKIYTGKRNAVDLDKYPPFPVKNRRFGAIEITRGCPYVCYFCQTPYILGTKPRHRSIEIICKYVLELQNYYGDLTDVRFITPNAFSYGSKDGKNLNLGKLEKLLYSVRQILGNEGRIFLGTFPSEVRPEHVIQDTLNLILKYADNDNITIGAQSGSQKILDLCHRDHSVEDIYSAVELTLENNLKINVDFIFGLPEEDEEDIKLTIKMMKYLAAKGARIHAHSFIPLPQTPFANAPVKRIKLLYNNEIKSLISKGFAFGDWKKQERLAIKIANYMKKMNIK
ncbi:MAG: TIGR04013 family B12-binding domain/radical SAM domain-containing protein [Candidatus Hodarchaeota archaeon]